MFAPPGSPRKLPGLKIDYTDEGHGRPVVLIHSSVSGNRQWRSLTEALTDRYRVLAPNLYGYGETHALAGDCAAVALRTGADRPRGVREARRAGRPRRPFLRRHGRAQGRHPARPARSQDGAARAQSASTCSSRPAARRRISRHATCATTSSASARWAIGIASPSASPTTGSATARGARCPRSAARPSSSPCRRTSTNGTRRWTSRRPSRQFQALTCADAGGERSRDTRRPIREIVEILDEACPHWSFRSVAEGGHMAPLTQPELVNPIVRAFLDATDDAGAQPSSAAGRRRSASAGGSGRRAPRPCRPLPASGS